MPELARRHGIQGNVLLRVEITRSGEVANPRVLRSASYGFDEAAIASISKWKFQPARKDGQPIPVELTLEMNFQVGVSPSAIRENEDKVRKREDFNRAIAAVQSPNPDTARKGLDKVLALSAKRFAPAQFSEGMWRLQGKPLPSDKDAGLRLILAAANQQYPAAVGQVGIFHYEGRHLPKDPEKGMKMLKAAAESGSHVSQLYLANIIESEQRDQAVRYYRMCAAVGQSLCQTRLAAQLLRAGTDRVEPIAWLQLAAGAKHEPAERLLAIHLPKLTPAEATRAAALSRELAPSHP